MVLRFSSGAPMPFSVLQRRIGRQSSLRDPGEAPAAFMVYDLLELGGAICGALPCAAREKLASLVQRARSPLALAA